MKKVALGFMVALGWSTAALAATDWDRVIKEVGVNSSTTRAYFSADTPPSLGASCQGYYSIDLSTVGGRAQYAAVLSAKVSGKRVRRIDYALAGGFCTASLVEIQDMP